MDLEIWEFPLYLNEVPQTLYSSLLRLLLLSLSSIHIGVLAVHVTCQAHYHLNTFALLLFLMLQILPLNSCRPYSLISFREAFPDWCSTITPLLPLTLQHSSLLYYFPMTLCTFWLNTVDPWTWGLRVLTPAQSKIHVQLLTL